MLFIAGLFVAGISPVIATSSPISSSVDVVSVEELAEQAYQERVDALQEQLADVHVKPYASVQQSDGTVTRTPILPSEDGYYMLNKRVIVGLEPISWLAQPVIEDHIEFSGVVEPHGVVTLIVGADSFVVEDAIADRRGRWSIALGVDSLTAGNHPVYVQSATEELETAPVKVAEFAVESREQVSSATWVVIIGIGLALIIILMFINVHFYLSRRKERQYEAPAAAAEDPDTHIEMDQEVIESMAENGGALE